MSTTISKHLNYHIQTPQPPFPNTSTTISKHFNHHLQTPQPPFSNHRNSINSVGVHLVDALSEFPVTFNHRFVVSSNYTQSRTIAAAVTASVFISTADTASVSVVFAAAAAVSASVFISTDVAVTKVGRYVLGIALGLQYS